ncbi:hypothetical protein ES704_01969 [subsurface metagenome]|jgi:hypothetical protein
MIGTKAKCPNKVKNYFGDMVPCRCERYTTIKKGVFTLGSGYDPLACKVKCKECGHIYIIFPSLNFKDKEID